MTETVSKSRRILQSLGGKVVAVLIAVALAGGLSIVFTHVTFDKTLRTISDIVAPDQKLLLLNRMLRNITQLEATHYRADDLSHGSYLSYQARTNYMRHMLDTLSEMYISDPIQLSQIDSIKMAMNQRNELVRRYTVVQSELTQNRELARQIRSLSEMVDTSMTSKAGTIITTEKKVTTSMPASEAKQTRTNKTKAFFERLFAKKKKDRKMPPAEKTVQEQLSIKTDTLIDSQRDSMINEIRIAASHLGQYQRSKNSLVLYLEGQIDRADTRLTDQLLKLVQRAEDDELGHVRSRQSLAEALVHEGRVRLNVIMLVFFLTVLVLTLFIFADIARSNTYRRQLQTAKEEAEYLSQVKQRFLANMSHEIRTPLQSIIGFAEQAQQQAAPDKAYIRSIHKASEHLLHIVNEVLDYSRIVSGKFTFEPKDFDLGQLISEVSGAMAIEAAQKGLRLHVTSTIGESKLIHGDAFRLRQILYNLLGNAVKFTDQGAVELAVSCSDRTDGSLVTFQVRDTGIGIAAADLERIFNEFEQADITVSRQRGGTGLGLTIVKALIDSQGGEIKINSRPGEGSVFEVRLFFANAAMVEAASMPALNMMPATGMKVLVIDDDKFILHLCHVIMDKYGIAHRCSSSPVAIVQQPWDEEIKLVLVDIRMPEMSGIDLCHELRRRLRDRIMIYALTAQPLPEEKEGVYRNEFDGVLMKPFREQEFLNLLMRRENGDAAAIAKGQTQLNDLAGLKKLTLDDPDLLKKVLLQFVRDTTADLHQLAEYTAGNNTHQVSEILHRLAGRVGQIGATELSALIREVEADIRRGFADSQIRSEVPPLTDKMYELIKEIDTQLSHS